MIPRVLHHIWLGTKDIPQEFLTWEEDFRKLNQNFSVKFWDEEELAYIGMRCHRLFLREEDPAGRADIARLEILFQHGGFYGDMDIEWRRSLDDSLTWNADKFYCCWEDDVIANNAFMACAPGNEFCGELLDTLLMKGPRKRTQLLPVYSGPGLLTPLAMMNPDKVEILPVGVLTPEPYFRNNRMRRLTPHGIHHYANSWW